MTADDETGAANQMEAATEATRGAVLRLLEAGEVDPQYIVLAATRVTGELGADIARLGDLSTSRRSWGTWPTWCARPAGRTPKGRRWPGAPEAVATTDQAGGSTVLRINPRAGRLRPRGLA